MTKYDLRRYRDLRAEAKQISERIKEIELSVISPQAQVITGMPGGNTCGGKMPDVVAKLADLKQAYICKLDSIANETKRIEKAIEGLDDKERVLMRAYYFCGLTWERVACEMGCTWRNVQRLHSKCLQKIK